MKNQRADAMRHVSVIALPNAPLIIWPFAHVWWIEASITGWSSPSHGSLVWNEDVKLFTYTPDSGFAGADSFFCTARHVDGEVEHIDISISFSSPQLVAFAIEHFQPLPADVGLIVDPLRLGPGGPEEDRHIRSISLPAHGCLEILPHQRLRYRAMMGFTGVDGFIFSVVDRYGTRSDGSVTIQVLAKDQSSHDGVPGFAIDTPFNRGLRHAG